MKTKAEKTASEQRAKKIKKQISDYLKDGSRPENRELMRVSEALGGLYIYLPQHRRVLARLTTRTVRVWQGTRYMALFEDFAKRHDRILIKAATLTIPEHSDSPYSDLTTEVFRQRVHTPEINSTTTDTAFEMSFETIYENITTNTE